jgi:hypothetical protein
LMGGPTINLRTRLNFRQTKRFGAKRNDSGGK